MKKANKPLTVLVLILACLLLSFIFLSFIFLSTVSDDSNKEIDLSEYNMVYLRLSVHPSLKSFVVKSLDDGIISKAEYEEFRCLADIEGKKSLDRDLEDRKKSILETCNE